MYKNLFRNVKFEADGAADGAAGGAKVVPPLVEPKIESPTKTDTSVPYDRFKQIVDEKNKLKADLEKIETAKTEAEKKKLEDQGKFQEAGELAEKRATEAEARAVKAENEKKDLLINFKIGIEAKDQGINNIDDATKLIDLTKVTVNDDGTLVGVKEAIESLKKDKAYLFSEKKIGVHTDHAKGTGELERKDLLEDPVLATKIKKESPAEYNRIMGK